MTKIYRESDASLVPLQGAVVAVVGYGNQGRAQALNMRDSGVASVIVGSPKDASYDRAAQDGFSVYPIAEAVKRADVVLVLVPDEVQPMLFRQQIASNLRQNSAVCFASGYNIAFKLVEPPDHVDVVMVAPRMIGAAVRRLYQDGKGFPAFVDVAQDATGHAEERALALALAIGALRTGSLRVTFAHEAWMDLLTEQAVWPLIIKVMEDAFAVQVAAGLSPEAVLLELYLSHEPAEVFARAAEVGIFEQMKLHSRTSQYGQLAARPHANSLPIEEFIRSTLHDRIMSGAFATDWSKELASGSRHLEQLQSELSEHPMSDAERRFWETFGQHERSQ